MNQLLFFTMYMVLYTISAKSQHRLTGIVTDKVTGEALENVIIYNQTQQTHSHSDNLGNFVLSNVIERDSLRFYLIGYENVTMVYSERKKEISIHQAMWHFKLMIK